MGLEPYWCAFSNRFLRCPVEAPLYQDSKKIEEKELVACLDWWKNHGAKHRTLLEGPAMMKLGVKLS